MATPFVVGQIVKPLLPAWQDDNLCPAPLRAVYNGPTGPTVPMVIRKVGLPGIDYQPQADQFPYYSPTAVYVVELLQPNLGPDPYNPPGAALGITYRLPHEMLAAALPPVP